MARGRMISKAISLDEKVDALSNDTVRLLFTWLIPHLDCEGRMYGDAQIIKSIVFPRRHIDVRTIQKYLDELVKSGLVLRYSNVEGTFICCPNFAKHQTGLQKSKETPSQIPPFTPDLLQSKDSAKVEKSKKSLTQVEVEVKVKVEDKDIHVHFERFYLEYPKKEAKADALKAFKVLKPSLELLEKIIANLQARKQSPDWQKNSGKYIPLPATYLRGKRWEDEGVENDDANARFPKRYPTPEELLSEESAREFPTPSELIRE